MEQSKTESIETLRHTIQAAERNLQSLRTSLAAHEPQETPAASEETLFGHINTHPETTHGVSATSFEYECLDLEEYKRYGRQMIIPKFGLEGQPVN